MFICHACRRRTHALHTGPQELTCTRCGVVGFVEEFNQTVQSPSSDEFAWRRGDSTQPTRRNDPFDVMAAILREHESLSRLGGGPQQRSVGGVTFVSTGPRNEGNLAILGNPDAFFHYLPDAFLSMITSENFDNLINLVMGQTGERGPPPAAEAVRENLPWETLTTESANKYEECVICREPFQEGEKVRRLCIDPKKCPHAFHDQCIQEWLQRHNTCPICRFQLQTDDSGFESRRQTLERNLHRSLSSRSTSPQVPQVIPDQPAGPSFPAPRITRASRPEASREDAADFQMQASRSAGPILAASPMGAAPRFVGARLRTFGSSPTIEQSEVDRGTRTTSPRATTFVRYYQSSTTHMAPSPLEPRSAPLENRPSETLPSELRPREPQPYHHLAHHNGPTPSERSRSAQATYQDMLRNLGRAISRGFF